MIVTVNRNTADRWDRYIEEAEGASIFHSYGWQKVINNTFQHNPFYLTAEDQGVIKGILPLFLIKSKFFGLFMISMPFLDHAGVAADNPHAAEMLISEVIRIAKDENVDYVELRNNKDIPNSRLETVKLKVNFTIDLTVGEEALWNNLDKRVRNRIRKAEKCNLRVDHGNQYFEKFYEVYSESMRNFGTPVLSKVFFHNILQEFPEREKIFVVFCGRKIIAAKLVMFFKDTFFLVWSAFLKRYREYMPNYLLTWEVMKFAYHAKYKVFDMGRSTVNSGPFDFKRQWGGIEKQLYWQYYLNRVNKMPGLTPQNPKFYLAKIVWKHLPLKLTNYVGPYLAREIP